MNDLIQLEDIKANILFSSDDEVSNVIKKITESAGSIVVSVDTAKGRKETASLAARVAKSKTYLDGLGKDLVSGIKQQAKEIDNRRKTIRDSLDELKEEVRKPLTEFEEKEKARIALHEGNIDRLTGMKNEIILAESVDAIEEIEAISELFSSLDWEEYSESSERLISQLIDLAGERKSAIIKQAEQEAELARLKAEAEARDKKERDERIARESAESARLEAEQKAAKQREAEQAALRKAEQDKIDAQQAVIDAERREIEAAKRAEKDKQDAIAREKEKADQAIQDERNRALELKRLEEEQTAEREADKAHKAKVNNKAVADLVAAGVSQSAAKKAVVAIAKGLVENVKISY